MYHCTKKKSSGTIVPNVPSNGRYQSPLGTVPVSNGTCLKLVVVMGGGVWSLTWGKMRSTLGVGVLVQYQVYHKKMKLYQVDFLTYLVRLVQLYQNFFL